MVSLGHNELINTRCQALCWLLTSVTLILHCKKKQTKKLTSVTLILHCVSTLRSVCGMDRLTRRKFSNAVLLVITKLTSKSEKEKEYIEKLVLHHQDSTQITNNNLNTLRQRQNGCHFPDNSFKCICLNENVWSSIKISLKFVPRGPIDNIPALVQIMAWHLTGDRRLSEPMMAHITRAYRGWVKNISCNEGYDSNWSSLFQ